MNYQKLFGMNAKQICLVLFGLLIDLFVIGLLLLTIIYGWEYIATLLSAVWQFVTVDIPRMVIVALSGVFMVTLTVLWFIASLGGSIRGLPSQRSPLQRSYQFPKPGLHFPSGARTSTRLPAFRLPEITSNKSAQASKQLAENNPPVIKSLDHVSTSSQLPEIKQLKTTSLSSLETSTQVVETVSPETGSFLTRLLKWLRELEIKWPNIDWGSGGGAGWPSGYYRSTHVRGYFRRDGTYVSGHSRRGYTRRSRRW